ncbi:BEN domain-containing protein 3-like [Polyodon spathula]|uniref:BEN domain-containing protein 3-like n=1 Tax=Polyodon spathula TaxID=7913 RepID=UPI001B7DE96F|nr:BEN domain-containing protein 3-like [Polyodon spathula]
MNTSEYGEDPEGEISKTEKRAIRCVKLEREMDDTAIDCSTGYKVTEGHKLTLPCTSLQITSKRTQMQTQIVEDGPGNEQDMPSSMKRIKFAAEGKFHGLRSTEQLQAVQRNMECTSTLRLSNVVSLSENKGFPIEKTTASYRKPLYSISHKITEKKNAPGLDQHTSLHESRERVNYNSLVLPKKVGEHNRREPSVIVATPETTNSDSNMYSLIEKMFFILNTLNSSMTQLHSKVDVLSLEVTRIKKCINPAETVAEFHPPPEYQLNSEELKQLVDQTSLPGDLACRLLVQLFPELFTVDDFNRSCNACGIVDSVNNTTTPPSANQTNGMNVTTTLSPTSTLSGSGNSTTTKGTGNGLQCPLSSILVPLITSASILRLCC